MENSTLKELVILIDKSSYPFDPFEQELMHSCRAVAISGADLPPDESLQIENLFEKIKRKGLLNI